MVAKWNILIVMLFLFCVSVLAVDSDSELIFKQGEIADIKVPCLNNNSYCDASITCNMTIIRPDTTTWINNALMTRQIAFYNYTIPAANITTIGSYALQVVCTNGGSGGYIISEFKITQSGMSGIGKETIVPAVVLIAILLFCVFMAWSLPEEEHAVRLLFIGLAMFMLLIMLQYANLATNEDAVGLTSLLNTTYTVLLPVIVFIISYFILVKFLMPLLNNLNKTYKERKQGKE